MQSEMHVKEGSEFVSIGSDNFFTIYLPYLGRKSSLVLSVV